MNELINLFTLNFIQWPAMIATIVSAWLVGSLSNSKRLLGFWVFILSNILWVIWGIHTTAYAIVVMQVGLMILNVRGVIKNKESE